MPVGVTQYRGQCLESALTLYSPYTPRPAVRRVRCESCVAAAVVHTSHDVTTGDDFTVHVQSVYNRCTVYTAVRTVNKKGRTASTSHIYVFVYTANDILYCNSIDLRHSALAETGTCHMHIGVSAGRGRRSPRCPLNQRSVSHASQWDRRSRPNAHTELRRLNLH